MSTLQVTNIQDTAGANSLTTAQLYSGAAKAWVNFNGTGTVSTNQTIRASFNVSSVFKNATGDYKINFTNSFVDANYCVVLGNDTNGGTTTNTTGHATIARSAYVNYVYSASAINLLFGSSAAAGLADTNVICVSVFR